MDKTVNLQRECPNCKFKMEVSFENKKLASGVIKICPKCNSPGLFCSDDYIAESISPLRKIDGR